MRIYGLTRYIRNCQSTKLLFNVLIVEMSGGLVAFDVEVMLEAVRGACELL